MSLCPSSHYPSGSAAQLASRILPLIDLTSLNSDDTDAVIRHLCRQAVTPREHGCCLRLSPFY